MTHPGRRTARTAVHAVLAVCLLLHAPAVLAGGLDADAIDRLASRAMTAFDVPGMAIGVVKDGAVVYARGHGVRELGRDGAIDTDTPFKVASNSKAFTAAALAILVDEGLVEKRRGRGMFVNDGARKQLLKDERERFVKQEWPKVVETIERLGLDVGMLLADVGQAAPKEGEND